MYTLRYVRNTFNYVVFIPNYTLATPIDRDIIYHVISGTQKCPQSKQPKKTSLYFNFRHTPKVGLIHNKCSWWASRSPNDKYNRWQLTAAHEHLRDRRDLLDQRSCRCVAGFLFLEKSTRFSWRSLNSSLREILLQPNRSTKLRSKVWEGR